MLVCPNRNHCYWSYLRDTLRQPPIFFHPWCWFQSLQQSTFWVDLCFLTLCTLDSPISFKHAFRIPKHFLGILSWKKNQITKQFKWKWFLMFFFLGEKSWLCMGAKSKRLFGKTYFHWFIGSEAKLGKSIAVLTWTK